MPLVVELIEHPLQPDEGPLQESQSHGDILFSKQASERPPYRQYRSEPSVEDYKNNNNNPSHNSQVFQEFDRTSNSKPTELCPAILSTSTNSLDSYLSGNHAVVSHPLQRIRDTTNQRLNTEILMPLGFKPVNTSLRKDLNRTEFETDGGSQGDLYFQRELFVVPVPVCDDSEGGQGEMEKLRRLQRCRQGWFVDARTEWVCLQFHNRVTRTLFIRKVFMLLFLEFLLAALWTICCVHTPELYAFVKTNLWIMYLCGGICIGFYFAIGCTNIGKSYPMNVVILIIFASVVSYICGAATVRYSTLTILLALSWIAGICFLLMVLTLFSKFDVTAWGVGIMLVGATGMIYGGVVAFCSFLIEEDETLGIFQITAAAIGGILISLYLLYDLQMILGGRRCQLSEEDWLYASMSLFYDIIMLFTYLLKMIRVFNNR